MCVTCQTLMVAENDNAPSSMKFSYRFLLFLASISTSFGASLTWDVNSTTTNAQDGAGIWDTTTTNWWNGTTDVAFTSGDTAIFGGATANVAYTVTLPSSLGTGPLTFTKTSGFPRYTIDIGSANTLTVNGLLTLNAEANAYTTAFTNGILALRATSTTSAAPDISFGNSAGSSYGTIFGPSTTVDLGTGTRYINGASQRNDLGRYAGDLRFDGPLTGSANVVFTGIANTGGSNGTSNMHFVLNAANTGFSGGVTLGANVDLALTNANALSAANSVTFTPAATRATLFLFGKSVTIGNLIDTASTGTRGIRNGSLNTTSGGTNTSGAATSATTGSTALGTQANSVLTITQTTNGTFGGIISDGLNDNGVGTAAGTGAAAYMTLGITKAGAATLTLSGANTYTGPTSITGGTLGLTGAGNIGAGALSISSGATLTYDSTLTSHSFTYAGLSGAGNLALQDNAGTPAAVNLTIGSNNTAATFSGVLSGVGGLTKTGTAMETLSGANTFSGGTTLANGSLAITSSIGTGPLVVTSTTAGDLLYFNSTAATTIPNNITLAAPTVATTYNLLKNAASTTTGTQLNLTGVISGGNANHTLFLNGYINGANSGGDNTTNFRFAGANTFRSTIRLNRGTITLGNASGLGDTANKLILDANNNTTLGDLRFESSMTFVNPITLQSGVGPMGVGTNNVALTGAIDGAGGLTKLGTGTLTLTGTNTSTGSTTITAGTLQVGTGTTGGIGTGALVTNAGVAFNLSGNQSVGAVSGTGTITQNGAGTLTFTGIDSHSGATTLTAGTLNAAGGITGNGPLSISSGLFAFGGGTGNPIGTAAISSLTQSGGTVSLDVSGGTSDTITVSGDYTSTGGGIAVNVLSTPTTDVPFTLVNYTGNLTAHPAITVTGLAGSRLTYSVDYGTGAGSAITITFTGTAGNLTWTGSTNANWDLATANWSNGVGPDIFNQLDNVTFDDSADPTKTNVALNFTATPTSVTFANSSYNYTLSGTGGISGPTTLIQTGSGTTTLATNNSYTGITTLYSGTLQVGAGGAIGTPGTADIQDYGAVVFNRSDAYVLPNNITGTGSVTQSGTGTLAITGSLSQSSLTISSGILQIGNGGTTGTVTSAPIVNNAGLAVSRSDASYTLSNVVSGTGSLTKIGSTTLVLSGTNTYSGGTAFSAGTLQVTDPSNIGTGPLNFNGAGTFNVANTSAYSMSNNIVLGTATGNYIVQKSTASTTTGTPLTLSGTISGGGAGVVLYFNSPTTNDNTTAFVLAPNNTFTGQVTVNRGVLVITGPASLGVSTNLLYFDTYSNPTAGDLRFTGSYTVPNPIQLSFATHTLLVDGTDAITLSGVVSQLTGQVRAINKIGTGTLILSNTNTYTGGTSIAADGGVLAITQPGALSTGAVSLSKGGTSGGTLELRMTGTNTVTNNFTFSSATGFTGGGSAHIRNVSGTNTLSGSLTLTASGGNGINLQSDADLLTVSGTVSSTFADSTRQLGLAGGGNGVVSGPITDGGVNLFSVVKSGTGTWTLSGSDTYHGTTTVVAGTLAVNGTLGTATGAVTVQSGAVLTGSGTISRPVTVSGKIAPGNGVGTLTVPSTVTFGADSIYAFQLADWNGSAGTGYDQVVATSLAVTATNTNKFVVNVDASSLANFTETTKTFVIATGVPTGLATDNWAVTTTGFSGTGTWKLQTNGNQIELVYTIAGTGFDTYMAAYPGVGGLTGPLDDFDKDGIPNLLEYVLSGNPTVSNRAILPASTITGGNLVFTYNRRVDSKSDTTQVVQYSSDLSTWTDITVTATSGGMVTVTPVDASNDTVTVTIPMGSAPKIFARLKATK